MKKIVFMICTCALLLCGCKEKMTLDDIYQQYYDDFEMKKYMSVYTLLDQNQDLLDENLQKQYEAVAKIIQNPTEEESPYVKVHYYYDFDESGNVKNELILTDGNGAYITQKNYYPDGMLKKESYGDGDYENITEYYDREKYYKTSSDLQRFPDVHVISDWDAAGIPERECAIKSTTLSDGEKTEYFEYDENGILTYCYATTGCAYTKEENGNLITVTAELEFYTLIKTYQDGLLIEDRKECRNESDGSLIVDQIQYRYDAQGRIIERILNDHEPIHITYTDENQFEEMIQGDDKIRFIWDEDRINQIIYSDGVIRLFDYNEDGNLTCFTHKVKDSDDWTFVVKHDASGRVLSEEGSVITKFYYRWE